MTNSVVTSPDALALASGRADRGLRFIDRRERARWIPWPDVVARAEAVAGGLQSLGVGRGQRVALVYPTTPEFVDALFGAQLAGVVPVPLYPPGRLGGLEEYRRRTARMIAAAGVRLVLADEHMRHGLEEMIAGAEVPFGCLSIDELPGGRFESVPVAAEDLALVQFSSGTTLAPKPVALSHRAVMGQARLLNSHWPDGDEHFQSGVSWLPLYHDMGLIGCLFSALERPGDLTLLPPEAFVARPAIWLRTISRYRATISAAPNFAYALATERVRDDEMEGVDLSCWRVALNGAETVVPDVARRFVRRFAPYGFRAAAMTPVYGLSEAALAVTFSSCAAPLESARFDREVLAAGEASRSADGLEITSVGRPLPGVELQIRDDAGDVLEEARVGRIWVRSETLMEGYLGRAHDTRRVLVDGWLDTGDLGVLLEGRLYLTGRAGDMLLLRGRNYSPDELEQAMSGVAGIRSGGVAAVSYRRETDPGERLLLLAEHERRLSGERRAMLSRNCREAVLTTTGLLADEIEILPPGVLPRTSSGKIRRQEALRRWLEARPESAETAPPEVEGVPWRSRQGVPRATAAPGDRDAD